MMNLSSALTSRDKKMLYALVFIVVIFLFGWCLIRPIYKKIVETSEQLEVAASVKATNEAKVIGYTNAANVTAKFEEELAASTEEYYDMMDSSQIDKLVTSYILNKGLIARNLTITMPNGPVSLSPYVYSDLYSGPRAVVSEDTDYNADLKDSELVIKEDEKKNFAYFKDAVLGFITGQTSEPLVYITTPTVEYAEARNSSGTSEYSGIYCVNITMLMEGDEETEQKVIDELSHNPSVRVTGFNWITLDPITYLQEDGTILMYDNESKQLQISVDLYMTERNNQ